MCSPLSPNNSTFLIQFQDIAPDSIRVASAEPLEQVQETVDTYLAEIVADIMGVELLTGYLNRHGIPFNLNWDTFYVQLKDRLAQEGFLRYSTWAKTRVKRSERKRRARDDSALPPRKRNNNEQFREMARKSRVQGG
jgi:hypothetical protein